MISTVEALTKLREGNARFVAGKAQQNSPQRVTEMRQVVAAVLGCADPRVTPELLFDQGLGDLFVVRVAGQVATEAVMGSLEFAVKAFEAPLIVVLGHDQCGAVAATLSALRGEAGAALPHFDAFAEKVRPSAKAVIADGPQNETTELVKPTVHAHVAGTIEQLQKHSDILARASIVSAYYNFDSGRVDFGELGK